MMDIFIMPISNPYAYRSPICLSTKWLIGRLLVAHILICRLLVTHMLIDPYAYRPIGLYINLNKK